MNRGIDRTRHAAASLEALLLAGAFVVSAVVPLGLSGCKLPGQAQVTSTDDKAVEAPPIGAHFAKVTQQSLPRRLDVTGTLDPDEKSEIAAQAAGIVLKAPIDLGTRVKKGDLLVELDSREATFRFQNASATAQEQRARLGLDQPGHQGSAKVETEQVADVRSAKEALDLADLELQRDDALLKEGAIAQAQYDTAKSNRERAAAAYDMARNATGQAYAGLSAAEAQAGLSQKTLDDTKIKAPFDGIIAEKRVAEGEFASLGRVVCVLVKDDVLRLHFDVAEADIGGIHEGADVEVHVAAFPDACVPRHREAHRREREGDEPHAPGRSRDHERRLHAEVGALRPRERRARRRSRSDLARPPERRRHGR